MKILRTPNAGGKWIAVQRGLLERANVTLRLPHAIRKLKRAATHCVYCGGRLIWKQTDHMVPLALGGEHSLRNIVIVCPDCNARKARLSYAEWVERVEPQHRGRVVELYRMRYEDKA